MIVENTGLKGLQSELKHLDEVMSEVGFVRWQWEYYRATYDYKMVDSNTNDEYFLRINARVTDGKMESPYAVLVLEDVYVGIATFPHGLDYDSEIPKSIMASVNKTLAQLKEQLV
jgi:hypothetical protein